MIKKILVIAFSLILLLILCFKPKETLAQGSNEFRCICDSGDCFTSNSTWGVLQENCIDSGGFEAVGSKVTCSESRGCTFLSGWECVVPCIQTPTFVSWTNSCDPAVDICAEDPNDPGRPVTCRESFYGGFFCLKSEGFTSNGNVCADISECSGYPSSGDLPFCGQTPDGDYRCYAFIPAGQTCSGVGDPNIIFPVCSIIPPVVPPSPPSDSMRCERDGPWEFPSAIGCIPIGVNVQPFVTFFLTWAGGIAGGIAFLLMIYAGFLVVTSAGDPQRLQAGKELLTSAVSGLVLIIFSAFLLRVIGVDILQLPGL